jgi:hypothetical protein
VHLKARERSRGSDVQLPALTADQVRDTLERVRRRERRTPVWWSQRSPLGESHDGARLVLDAGLRLTEHRALESHSVLTRLPRVTTRGRSPRIPDGAVS